MISTHLPKSAVIVLDQLKTDGPMTPKEIAGKSKLAPRTVSFALRKLLTRKLCCKTPNLSDMRQPIYKIDAARIKEVERTLERLRIQVEFYRRSM